MRGLITLDFGGIVLFLLGVCLIILGTAWGGSTYPWDSAPVIVSLILGAILLLLFATYEYLLEPGRILSQKFPRTVAVIPFVLLRKKDVWIVCLMAAAAASALYSAFYFIGIYFTLVQGYSAGSAGTQLLYYIPGLGVGVWTAMYLCNGWPRQTFWPLFLGAIVETGGAAALTYAVKSRNNVLVNVMMAITGAGTGTRFMPLNLHIAGMFREHLAPVNSLLRFSFPFGGTLALTIMGSVFQNKMATFLGNNPANEGGRFSLHDQDVFQAIDNLPHIEQEVIRSAGATATMWAFVSILPLLALSMISSSGLGNVWISQRRSKSQEEKADITVPAEELKVLSSSKELESNHPTVPLENENVSSNARAYTSIYLLALTRGGNGLTDH